MVSASDQVRKLVLEVDNARSQDSFSLRNEWRPAAIWKAGEIADCMVA
jgi:hypothetical protein